MKILVYPHTMEIGGSQLNAIELAGAVRDLGHDVTVISDDGPLVDLVRELGLEHLALPARRRRPSPAVARRLRGLIHERGLDIVHGYEWPPALEAAAATFPGSRAAGVCTVLSMAVAPFLPASMPLVVGTLDLQRRTAAGRRGPVHLIEPPVDVIANAPGHPVDAFRASYDLADEGMIDLVVVCRLVPELKLEGILTAIDVVGQLGRERPVRLVIVGDGTAGVTVRERAAKANAQAGRRAVVVTGELRDPRPAYAAADIVLGMGGSALRGLAFGRPLVVQGLGGYWELLTPDTCGTFLRQGWWGIGDGSGGAERLTAILLRLLDDAALRDSLGLYGRQLAEQRFSLQRAARVLEGVYLDAAARRAAPSSLPAWAVEGSRAAAGLVSYKVRRRYQSMRGAAARDDFNAAALAQHRPAGGNG